MKTVFKVLGTLLLMILIAIWIGLSPTSVPSDCPPFPLERVRELARAVPGDLPSAIRTERIVNFRFPELAVRAGAGFQMIDMGVQAYQVMFPTFHLVIDTGLSEAHATEQMGDKYDAAAFTRLRATMTAARAIYVTHEHSDHMGGIFADETLFTQAFLNPEQLASPERLLPAVISPAARDAVRTLPYEQATAVAPGVVLVRAPGHTPGSQYVYILRADGTEVLLVGDTAWQMSNVEHQQGPPRLTTLALKNDRHSNSCQLAALHTLLKDTKIYVVPGHDLGRVADLTESGVLMQGFATNQTP